MTDTKRRGAPPALWIIGVLLVAGGLLANARLRANARQDAIVSRMFRNMSSGDVVGVPPDFGAANVALAVVAVGVLLLAVALTVHLVRRP